MGVSESEHPNTRLARKLWEALSRGDVEAFLEVTRPELLWHTLGDNPFAIETKGAHSMLALLASFGESVDDLRMEVRDIFASDRGAVLHYSAVTRFGPELLDCDYLVLMRMDADHVVEGTTVPLDPRRNDAFWCRVPPPSP